MSEQQKNIGENICELRKQNNMSQEELAEQLNVSRQAISNWERNKTQPDISTIAKMSSLFGTNVDNIIRGEYVMMSRNEKDSGYKGIEKINKYDMAIGLFYAISLFISIGVCLIIGLIYHSSRVWIIAGVGSVVLFLTLGLTAHAIITLVRKDKQYNDD